MNTNNIIRYIPAALHVRSRLDNGAKTFMKSQFIFFTLKAGLFLEKKVPRDVPRQIRMGQRNFLGPWTKKFPVKAKILGQRHPGTKYISIYLPVLYTVVLLSPSVYYTHDFWPKNREW